jgi:hypothetical protein
MVSLVLFLWADLNNIIPQPQARGIFSKALPFFGLGKKVEKYQ